uniref:Uncharacterized protein n=1 Tax=Chlamydomonas chlamydogama TaxID=225041 RepID=A0A7S2QSG0_9CHLO
MTTLQPDRVGCKDLYSNTGQLVQFQALLPPDTGVWTGQTMSLTASTTVAAAYLRNSSLSSLPSTAPDTALRSLYNGLGLDLTSTYAQAYPTPSTLLPSVLISSSSLRDRGLGAALMSIDSEITSYLALGTCLLATASPVRQQQSGDITQALAATLMQVVQRQGPNTGASSLMLTTMPGVRYLLNSVIAQLNPEALSTDGLLAAQVNSTAAVIQGFTSLADVYKLSAFKSMAGPGAELGVDVVDAVNTLAALAVVQSDACVAVQQMVAVGGHDLSSYLPGVLPDKVQQAVTNYPAILSALGLPQPDAPQPVVGMTLMVGPLPSCPVEAWDEWGSRSQTVRTDSAGRFKVASRPVGWLSSYGSSDSICVDPVTFMSLNFTLSNYVPPVTQSTVGPVTLLAEGFYKYLASTSLMVLSSQQQQQAFTAMGLDLQRYLQALPLDPGLPASTTFMSEPRVLATAAAAIQLTALFFSSAALFTPSVQVVLNVPNVNYAADIAISLTAMAVAKESLSSPSGRIYLNSAATVSNIFNTVEGELTIPTNSGAALTALLQATSSESPATGSKAQLSSDNSSSSSSGLEGPGHRRSLILTNNVDFGNAKQVLRNIVVAASAPLEAVKQACLNASLAGSSVGLNASAVLLQVARTAVVLQQQYYPAALKNLNAAFFSLANLLRLEQEYGPPTFTPAGLASVPVNTAFICTATSNCVLPPPPPPVTPSSSSSKSKVGLILGVSLGVGIPLLLILAYLLYRCCQERSVEQVVQKTQHTGGIAAYSTQQQAQPYLTMSNPAPGQSQGMQYASGDTFNQLGTAKALGAAVTAPLASASPGLAAAYSTPAKRNSPGQLPPLSTMYSSPAQAQYNHSSADAYVSMYKQQASPSPYRNTNMLLDTLPAAGAQHSDQGFALATHSGRNTPTNRSFLAAGTSGPQLPAVSAFANAAYNNPMAAAATAMSPPLSMTPLQQRYSLGADAGLMGSIRAETAASPGHFQAYPLHASSSTASPFAQGQVGSSYMGVSTNPHAAAAGQAAMPARTYTNSMFVPDSAAAYGPSATPTRYSGSSIPLELGAPAPQLMMPYASGSHVRGGTALAAARSLNGTLQSAIDSGYPHAGQTTYGSGAGGAGSLNNSMRTVVNGGIMQSSPSWTAGNPPAAHAMNGAPTASPARPGTLGLPPLPPLRFGS